MIKLDNAKKVIVNNTLFVKKEDNRWYSATDVMMERQFITYCLRANSVELLEDTKKVEKSTEKVEKSAVKPAEKQTKKYEFAEFTKKEETEVNDGEGNKEN